MFDSYNEAHLDRIAKYRAFDESNIAPLENGHRNMLNNAVLSFYMAGHLKKATEVFRQLRTLYPREDNNYSLQEFCKVRMKEEFEGFSIHDAMETITMLLREAYFRYAIGEDNESKGREDMARQAYELYLKVYG